MLHTKFDKSCLVGAISPERERRSGFGRFACPIFRHEEENELPPMSKRIEQENTPTGELSNC